VKIPKWQFEKFPGTDESLGPQMKSVGEAMAIGRTFKEALMKGVRSLETGRKVGTEHIEPRILTHRLVTPHPERLTYLRYALAQGMSVKELNKMTSIDPWFLYQLKEITTTLTEIGKQTSISSELLREAKRVGLSDERIGLAMNSGAAAVRHLRTAHKIRPVYKLVDTCAAEFESYTPY